MQNYPKKKSGASIYKEGGCKQIWNAYDKYAYVDGLEQDCSNSLANALELLRSCTKSMVYITDMDTCLVSQYLFGWLSDQQRQQKSTFKANLSPKV